MDVPNLNIYFQNVRSLKTVNKNHNELRNLKHFLTTDSPDILCLVETWLDSNILDHELTVEGYSHFRKDRGSRGGGLLVYSKEDIICTYRPDLVGNSLNYNEILVCEVFTNQGKMYLITFYRPPNSNNSFSENLKRVLDNIHTESLSPRICLAGDLNLPEINWADMTCNSALGRNLCSILNEHQFSQINKLPSRAENANVLDTVITNFPNAFSDTHYVESNFQTDHFMIEFQIQHKPTEKKKEKRWLYKFKEADYNELNFRIEELDLESKMKVHGNNIDLAWDTWLFNIQSLINNYIPRCEIKHRSSPWIDGECLHLIHLKKEAWKKAKRTNNDQDWIHYKTANNLCKQTINNKYHDYLQSAFENMNESPKLFWKLVGIKNNSPSSLPHEMTYKDTSSPDSSDKVNFFNEFFYSSFNGSSYTLPDITAYNNDNLNYLHFSHDDIFQVLSSLNPNKACGPDGIPGIFLKGCAQSLSSSLEYLFNLSFTTGKVPLAWKKAHVAPVFKKGNKNLIENYRPISLLCIVSKCLERCIVNKIYPILDQQIHQNQHGFRKEHSTTTQLTEFYDKVSSVLDSKSQCDSIFLDLSKAFDSVSHRLLIHKLRSFGINGYLLNWLQDYLTFRSQSVVCEGVKSSVKPVISGVPQGSILGPLLFILFINDLPDVTDCDLYLYADDAKVMKPIYNLTDCDKLQQSLDSIVAWSKKWGLTFNPTKCKSVSFSRKKNPIQYNYNMSGTTIDSETSFSDLGVLVDTKLEWSEHINNITNKANQRLGLVKRTLGYNTSSTVKLQCYKSLIQPLLEYCTPVWSNCSRKNAEKVESVQRRATAYIMNDYQHERDYKTRLTTCDLLPLSYRRIFLDLSFLMNSLLENNCINFETHFKFLPATRTRDDLIISALNTKRNYHLLENYFFQRVSGSWNVLPYDIRDTLVNLDDIAPAKDIIKKHLFQIFYDKFITSMKCTWYVNCTCTNCKVT